jgi:hypothetical protein
MESAYKADGGDSEWDQPTANAFDEAALINFPVLKCVFSFLFFSILSLDLSMMRTSFSAMNQITFDCYDSFDRFWKVAVENGYRIKTERVLKTQGRQIEIFTNNSAPITCLVWPQHASVLIDGRRSRYLLLHTLGFVLVSFV